MAGDMAPLPTRPSILSPLGHPLQSPDKRRLPLSDGRPGTNPTIPSRLDPGLIHNLPQAQVVGYGFGFGHDQGHASIDSRSTLNHPHYPSPLPSDAEKNN